MQGAQGVQTKSRHASGIDIPLFSSLRYLETTVRPKCCNFGPMFSACSLRVEPPSFVQAPPAYPGPEPLRHSMIEQSDPPEDLSKKQIGHSSEFCHCAPPFAGSLSFSLFLDCLHASREGPSKCSPDWVYRSKRETFSQLRLQDINTSTLNLVKCDESGFRIVASLIDLHPTALSAYRISSYHQRWA